MVYLCHNRGMAEPTVTTQKQALSILDQLSTFVITKKGPQIRQREKFSDDVLRSISLYKTKINKADMPSQFTDIVAAAKHELKTIFDKHAAE